MRAEFKVGDKDFTPQLLQDEAGNPEFIFAVGQVPEASIIVRQARELGLRQPIFGGAASVDNTLITNAGPAMPKAAWAVGWRALFLDSRPPRHGQVQRGVGQDEPERAEGPAESVRRHGLHRGPRHRRGHAPSRPRPHAREVHRRAGTIENYRISEIATPRTFSRLASHRQSAQQMMVVIAGHWVPLRWDPLRESEVLADYKK